MSTAQALPADDPDDHAGGPPAGGVRRLPTPAEALRAPLPASPVDALRAVRERTRILVDGLTREELEEQLDPLMSPLVWDLAHIAAYEDLWLVHRHGDRPLLHPELADLYDAFETPRQARGDLELLDVPQAWDYLDDVRARVLEVAEERGVDDELFEMVLQHEMQHTETMLQTMRLGGLTSWLGGLPGGTGTSTSTTGEAALHAGAGQGGPAAGSDAPSTAMRPISAAARSRAEVLGGTLLRVPGGDTQVGAAPDVFSYDNERPRHARTVAAFRIAPRPVTVSQWDAFVADGGTRDQRFWSDAGWAWRAGGAGSGVGDATGDGATGGNPAAGARGAEASVASVADDVVCHLNAFQAEAFAAWAGLRLPTEAEWEHAAAAGILQDVGVVWEWTSTTFHGYPGFRPHPYKEYSEVFFDRGYRALRGGSFAAHPRVATTTFRNWDLPERRQIFAGVRLAADVAPTGREASA
ncbi:SUMF1/EgtB/PvdO family nonheme iron enzyme [Patulibacter minatonensis]|uniref:SUMF1/EgtB/PvdO family nonheme iron enzyme n=1 Tax=Patulibacter minatonensis TaxID=298163 RepID=UPI001B7F837F|nr:SUMF1/EgtB/PvdO family nonheme iron enzyme [Patulibacter minatonensis]